MKIGPEVRIQPLVMYKREPKDSPFLAFHCSDTITLSGYFFIQLSFAFTFISMAIRSLSFPVNGQVEGNIEVEPFIPVLHKVQ